MANREPTKTQMRDLFQGKVRAAVKTEQPRRYIVRTIGSNGKKGAPLTYDEAKRQHMAPGQAYEIEVRDLKDTETLETVRVALPAWRHEYEQAEAQIEISMASEADREVALLEVIGETAERCAQEWVEGLTGDPLVLGHLIEAAEAMGDDHVWATANRHREALEAAAAAIGLAGQVEDRHFTLFREDYNDNVDKRLREAEQGAHTVEYAVRVDGEWQMLGGFAEAAAFAEGAAQASDDVAIIELEGGEVVGCLKPGR